MSTCRIIKMVEILTRRAPLYCIISVPLPSDLLIPPLTIFHPRIPIVPPLSTVFPPLTPLLTTKTCTPSSLLPRFLASALFIRQHSPPAGLSNLFLNPFHVRLLSTNLLLPPFQHHPLSLRPFLSASLPIQFFVRQPSIQALHVYRFLHSALSPWTL